MLIDRSPGMKIALFFFASLFSLSSLADFWLPKLNETLDLDPPALAVGGDLTAHQIQLGRRALRMGKDLQSWMFLFDAEKDNPFYSSDRRFFRDHHPECVQRFLLEIIEKNFEEVASPIERAQMIRFVFSRENGFDTNVWMSNAEGSRGFLVGTDSETTRIAEGQVSPFLRSMYDYFVAFSNIETRRAAYDGAMKCTSDRKIIEKLQWFDRSAVQELLDLQDPQELSQAFRNIIQSTWIPLPRRKTPGIIGNPRLISSYSYALRPSIGFGFPTELGAQKILKSYWREVPAMAYDSKKRLTKDTCAILERAFIWGTLMGWEHDPIFREKFDFSEEDFLQWTSMGMALSVAAFDPDLSDSCIHAAAAYGRLTAELTDFSLVYSLIARQGVRGLKGKTIYFWSKDHPSWKFGLRILKISSKAISQPIRVDFPKDEIIEDYSSSLFSTR